MSVEPHPFSLRQLQYIVRVAERGSFRQAAEDCRVAQPSLSVQLGKVEEALGVKLFERDRRRVMSTSAGKVFVERARKLLLEADALVEASRALSDPFSGALRVGVIPTVGPYLLPTAGSVLRAAFPKLVFEWVEERTAVLVEKLERGELDAAVVALEAELGDLSRVTLGKDPFVFAAPRGHRLASSARALEADELKGEEVLLLDDGHCFREQALAVCSRVRAEASDYRATSLQTLVQMVAGGAGVTLLPTLALNVENRKRTLKIRRFAKKPPARTLGVVFRPGSARAVTLRGLTEKLREAFAKLVRAR
ncbi:MAG: LysR substrate-binding domain-containing protein [Myxococcota bacterium]